MGKNKNSENNIVYESFVEDVEEDISLIVTEKEKNKTIENIKNIYYSVFEKHQMGNLLIYNPNIFSELSEECFIYWIAKNNKDMEYILEK